MGRGKTMALINMINNSDENKRFLYITPYLAEVERVINGCKGKKFKQPSVYGNKLDGIRWLFKNKENIASTHKLFSMFSEEIVELVSNFNYTLIMDEVAEIVDEMSISYEDKKTILDKYAHIDKDGLLRWDAPEYTGKFEEYKRLCDLGCVASYTDSIFVWMFPISTFRAFTDIYILTYLFGAQTQKYYYDYFGLKYEYLYVKGNSMDTYCLTPNKEESYSEAVDYRELIHICDSEKLNRIGDLPNALSLGWYERHKNDPLIAQLKKNTTNFFVHYVKTKSNENLWTTFKEYKPLVSGKGYTKGFISSNMRSTNAYKDRIAVAYLINRFFKPFVKNFFNANGVQVDEDLYATSELLQFLFRSAIRERNEIWLYIPSSRMRGLLEDWIESVSPPP